MTKKNKPSGSLRAKSSAKILESNGCFLLASLLKNCSFIFRKLTSYNRRYLFSPWKRLVTTVLLGFSTDRIATSKALGSASLSEEEEMVLMDLLDKSNGLVVTFVLLLLLLNTSWASTSDVLNIS